MAEWTDSDIKTLRGLIKKGLSNAEIAKQMGRPRNSVIGKRHRLGIAASSTQSQTNASRSKGAASRGRKARKAAVAPIPFPAPRPKPAPPPPPPPPDPEPEPLPAAAEVVEVSEPIADADRPTILTVQHGQCRWIDDKHVTTDSLLCGAKVEPGSSWCPEHTKRVYLSAAASRKKAEATRVGREKGIRAAVAAGTPIRVVAERYRRSIDYVIDVLGKAA